jgi:hypothetical protein
MEASINSEENAVDEWIKLKEMVQLAMNQSDSMKGTVVTQVDRLDEKGELLEIINACQTIRNLEMFEGRVQRLNDPDIASIYNNKKKELQ